MIGASSLDFIFLHIPKCGGTSLRKILFEKLLNKYSKEVILYPEANSNINFLSNNIEKLNKIYNIDKLKVILSHCLYNDMKINTKFMITFLRDPIERIISHYYFFDYKDINIHMCDLPETEFNDFCTEHGKLMCNWLGLLDENNTLIEELLESRLNEFDFLGKIEHYDECIKALDLIINDNFKLSNTIDTSLVLNENKNKPFINNALKEKIRPFCKYDYILYNSFGNYKLKKNN
jgi:hypothetical protein